MPGAGRFFDALGVPQGQIAPTSIGPRRAFGTPQLNLTVKPSSVGPRRAFGTAKLNQQIGISSVGPRRAFGSPRLSPTQVFPQSIAPRRAFGTPSVVYLIRVPAIGPRRAFGSSTFHKTDLAEARRVWRVGQGLERDVDELRRFRRDDSTVTGTFAYRPLERTFDFAAEVREEEIQTADVYVAAGLANLGVFTEIPPVP